MQLNFFYASARIGLDPDIQRKSVFTKDVKCEFLREKPVPRYSNGRFVYTILSEKDFFVEEKYRKQCFTLRIVEHEAPSASRFLAGSTFSIEKVLHANDREAHNFQSNAAINESAIK